MNQPDSPIHPEQKSTTTAAPDERAATFHPVEQGEEVYNGPLLVVEAYALLWLILMGWLLLLWRKQNKITHRLHDVEQTLRAHSPPPA